LPEIHTKWELEWTHISSSYMGTVGICAKAFITRKNQTYFGENLQFSLIAEGFQSHYSFGKTFSFSSKTEGNTKFSVRLKQKVFQ
jgi:hypothetical protein